MAFAEGTSVPVERSRAEIESLVLRGGATEFASGWNGESAMIGFTMNRLQIQMRLPLPNKGDKSFAYTPSGRWRRTQKSRDEAFDQEMRRRWRALCLVVKAKLEAVQSGISTIEQEFLPYIVAPNGLTIGQMVIPKLEAMVDSKTMAPLLEA